MKKFDKETISVLKYKPIDDYEIPKVKNDGGKQYYLYKSYCSLESKPKNSKTKLRPAMASINIGDITPISDINKYNKEVNKVRDRTFDLSKLKGDVELNFFYQEFENEQSDEWVESGTSAPQKLKLL